VCVSTVDNAVDGVFLEVSNTEVPMCVSFECITDSGEMVVLAHHIGDDDGDGDDVSEKLSAYYLSSNDSCFTVLTTGSYVVGVFTRMENNLVPPTTGFTISETFSASPSSVFCAPGKHYFFFLNHHCKILSFYTVGAVKSECQIWHPKMCVDVLQVIWTNLRPLHLQPRVTRLIPRPHPAFRCLQYGKAGEAFYFRTASDGKLAGGLGTVYAL